MSLTIINVILLFSASIIFTSILSLLMHLFIEAPFTNLSIIYLKESKPKKEEK